MSVGVVQGAIFGTAADALAADGTRLPPDTAVRTSASSQGPAHRELEHPPYLEGQ